ncbi:MAG TPA: lysylphosphatidylglycerol synthase transmembrane domain-containing protein [Anaerolineales bacterium]
MVRWITDNRALLLRLLGTILAIVLIVVLVREEAWSEVVNAIRQLTWTNIAAALALVVLSRLFVAARWYVLLRSGGVKISIGHAAALTFTGLFSNNFLPTTIGGDVVRLAGAMQLGYDRAVALASLAADRLVGMLGMLFTLPLGLIPTLHALSQPASQAWALSGLAKRGIEFARRTLQTFSIWFSHPFALLTALGCTWGHMLCTFATMYLLIQSLGGHVGLGLIAGLWSVAYFVTLVPISINGYGVQELTLTFLFSKVAGLSSATSLTVAVLVRTLYIAVSLVGAIYLPGVLAAVDKRQPAGPPLD